MSFLLRKPSGHLAASRPQPGGTHRSAASKSKLSASTAKESALSRGGAQMQQLLQRRPATAQQKPIQSAKQKTPQVTAEEQKELQGVISMDEGERVSFVVLGWNHVKPTQFPVLGFSVTRGGSSQDAAMTL